MNEAFGRLAERIKTACRLNVEAADGIFWGSGLTTLGNKGAAGVDGYRGARLAAHPATLADDQYRLFAGTYIPQAVRRVDILPQGG